MNTNVNRQGRIMYWGAVLWLSAMLSVATAGEKERVGFTIMTMNQQFFTTPYEQSGKLGGSYMGAKGTAASTVKNPAALGGLSMPMNEIYWLYGKNEGEGGGTSQTESESITGWISDEGIYQVIPLKQWRAAIGFGGDYLATDYNDAPVTDPSQHGYRFSSAFGIQVLDNLSLGYGLMYLHDHAAWGSIYAPPGSNDANRYHMVHDSSSWRHRLGMQHSISGMVRWGVQVDVGYGDGDNRWNGRDPGGDNDLRDYGVRLGGQTDFDRPFKLSCDLDWRYMDVNFGRHSPGIGQNFEAKYAGDVYRAMFGVEQRLASWLTAQVGYRYNVYRLDDVCGADGNLEFHTLDGGLRIPLLDQRLSLEWNMEYSWVANGDFKNVLSVQYTF